MNYSKYKTNKDKYLNLKGGTLIAYGFEKELLDLYTDFTQKYDIDAYIDKNLFIHDSNRVDNYPLTNNEQLENIEDLNKLDTTKLLISNSFDTIKAIYNEHGVIQLRPYSGEPILIIGCGNFPLAYYERPINLGADHNRESYYGINSSYRSWGSHHHTMSYTINISLGANPSIVSDFSKQSYKELIPDGSFAIIAYEGVQLQTVPQDEITRLLMIKGIAIIHVINEDNTQETHVYYKVNDNHCKTEIFTGDIYNNSPDIHHIIDNFTSYNSHYAIKNYLDDYDPFKSYI